MGDIVITALAGMCILSAQPGCAGGHSTEATTVALTGSDEAAIAPAGEAAVAPLDSGGPPLTVVGELRTGSTPSYMALSPDGNRLYVVLEGGLEAESQVLVIDTNTNLVTGSIDVERGFAFQIALTADGTYAYLAVSQASGNTDTGGINRVDVLDLRRNDVAESIALRGSRHGPIGVVVSPAGRRIYATNRGISVLEVIDGTNRSLLASLEVGRIPVGVAMTPDGSRVYVANREDSTLTVIDAQYDSVASTIQTSLQSSDSTTSIACSPDGRFALITSSSDSRIAVISTDPQSQTYNQEVRVIETNGSGLSEIAFVDAPDRALVVSRDTDELLLVRVDPADWTASHVEQAITVGDSPVDVVVRSDDGSTNAYVTNSHDRTVTVVHVL